MNKISKLIPIIAVLALAGCNAGSSSWSQGNLGSLAVNANPNNVVPSGTSIVTASLTGAKQGTDPIGSATIYFKVATSYANGQFESSNIATLSAESCTINNPIAESVTSCSVILTGNTAGQSVKIYVRAEPNSSSNTAGPTNYVNGGFESLPYTDIYVTSGG